MEMEGFSHPLHTRCSCCPAVVVKHAWFQGYQYESWPNVETLEVEDLVTALSRVGTCIG
jgi:hypothetical protein